MRFPFVLRSRHEAELAAVRSYNNALRERCEVAEKNEATERFARRTITRQHAELDAANRRLAGRNLALGERISKLTEADPEYAASLEGRLDRALRACTRYRAALTAETRRADRLQGRLDDAVGLTRGGVKDSSPWQPGYKKPKQEAGS